MNKLIFTALETRQIQSVGKFWTATASPKLLEYDGLLHRPKVEKWPNTPADVGKPSMTIRIRYTFKYDHTIR